MDNSTRFRALGRFLYTQNPFYLISCGLIIYGLQFVTSGGGRQADASLLALGLIGYTLLMSVTVVAVVRWGKVWEDARSIFLVVLIGQLALSVGFDRLCVEDWPLAARLLGGGYLFSLLSTEIVLRGCRIRFPLPYRMVYAFLLGLFYVVPLIAGDRLAANDLVAARWSAVAFSALVAVGLLLLVPAIRQGNGLVRHNGTPWRWPAFPLSLFVVLIVVAAIRSHAIWMAFGSFHGAIAFEPFLLLPLAFAGLVLIVEVGQKLRQPPWRQTAMVVAPLLLLLGTSAKGMTNMAIGEGLRWGAGSAVTVACLLLLAFYLYTWKLGLSGSFAAVSVSLLFLGSVATTPESLGAVGAGSWTLTALAAIGQWLLCLKRYRSEVPWLAFSGLVALAIGRLGTDLGRSDDGWLLAGVWCVVCLMWFGIRFSSQLAEVLRALAALSFAAAGGYIAVNYGIGSSEASIAATVLGALAAGAAAYGVIVRRRGWLGMAVAESIGCVAVAAHAGGVSAETFSQPHWPLPSGIVCLAIGLTITSYKSGLAQRIRPQKRFKYFRRGF